MRIFFETLKNKTLLVQKKYIIIVGVLLFLCGIGLYVYNAPRHFPVGTVITIEQGDGSLEIANQFEKYNIVTSKILLNTIVIALGGERTIVSGEYVFNQKLNVLDVAKRITRGQFGLVPKKITIPEGLSSYEIAEVFALKIPSFDKEEFIAQAVLKEGYLFPDTYYFIPNAKPADIVAKLEENFAKKMDEIKDEIKNADASLEDIIIMASILEEEARLTRTRQIVAGILWNRIKKGMPLQVDGTFKYINGKGSADLTLSDLSIDSPYNTYKYKGLPPTAVSNPGLDSIKATLNPIKTEYVYFLTDNNGNMHYAKTLEEHVKNKHKYLR